MENSNKKPGQGKTPQQYKDSTRFAWYGVVGMIILLFLMTLLGGCTSTYYISDAEYSDVRESHASVVYFKDSEGCFFGTGLITNKYGIYWGWYGGSYYYYGVPHYYPWYYYYDKIPPSYYDKSTHIIINRPVNKPTHRSNIRVKTNTNRNNKVIIKNNNGSKRTNKTTIRRKPKK